jgi:separase
MGLLSESSKNESFSQALAIWSRWSDKAIADTTKETDKEEMKQVAMILGIPPPFAANPELLRDFFEFKSLFLLRVQCLHLLLKLQLYVSNRLDTIIPLYASLAVQYLRLGYTGKAGTLFAQGLKQMKDSQPSTSTQLQWHLHYAEYYACINVLDKARQHMAEAGEIYIRNFTGNGKRINPAERTERVLAVGRAGYVFSLIAFEESELEKAIGYIDYAIKVLKTGISAVERNGKNKNSSKHDDPFALERPTTVEKNTGVRFGSKVWCFKSVCSNAK